MKACIKSSADNNFNYFSPDISVSFGNNRIINNYGESNYLGGSTTPVVQFTGGNITQLDVSHNFFYAHIAGQTPIQLPITPNTFSVTEE
jgi:hypothetical protein